MNMKRLILSLLVTAGTSTAAFAADNDTTVCFTVNPPMSCVNCENKIKTNLRYEKGVKLIEASAKEAVVTVKFDKRKTSVAKLIPAFRKIGYEASAVTGACEAKQAQACGSGCCSGKK